MRLSSQRESTLSIPPHKGKILKLFPPTANNNSAQGNHIQICHNQLSVIPRGRSRVNNSQGKCLNSMRRVLRWDKDRRDQDGVSRLVDQGSLSAEDLAVRRKEVHQDNSQEV